MMTSPCVACMVKVELGPGGLLMPSSIYVVPKADLSGAKETSSAYGSLRVSSMVYAGFSWRRSAAPSRMWTLIWPRGAERVVLAPDAAFTTSCVHQSRQMTFPLPGKIPEKLCKRGTISNIVRRPTVDSDHIRCEHRRDQDVAADHELPIDRKQLRLVRELPEQGTNGRGAPQRCV